MAQYVDQMGREVKLKSAPERIVSLVPSITEYLFALGLGDKVVGITKFCIYPKAWYQSKTKIGGTKNPSVQKIEVLHPDLILGNKEENREEDIAQMETFAPVWMSDVNTIDDMYAMLLSIGEMVGCTAQAKTFVAQWKKYFEDNHMQGFKKKALYVIWNEPIMVVGKNTYIDAYMTEIGFENVVSQERYPLLEDCQGIEPQEVLLSSEPYPFKEDDFVKFKSLFPKANIQLVSGEEFSWYGVRNLVDDKQ